MHLPNELLPDELLSARLPRWQDDEPPTLRQALIDEVRDYLQTAWEEELVHTPEPSTAWQQVLARFGDPARLVRKLWFDAMQEQLMSRRLNLAAFAFMALVIIGLSALNWRMFSSLEAVAANAEKTNALLLEKLSTLSRPVNEDSMTWRKLTVKLKSEDGSPVKGQVSLLGQPFGNPTGPASLDQLMQPIEETGEVRFGPIHVGKYQIMVEANGYRASQNVDLLPGQDREVSITTPAPATQRQVRLKFDVPKLQDSIQNPGSRRPEDSLWLIVYLENVGRLIGDVSWANGMLIGPVNNPFSGVLAVNSRGEAYEIKKWLEPAPQEGRPRRPLITVENWKTHPWKGILPSNVFRALNNELVHVLEENNETHTAVFQAVPQDGIQFSESETGENKDPSGSSFDLAKISPSSAPVEWIIPIKKESVDGHLITPDVRGGGMGGMPGGGGFF